jgi:hypothetical protein
MQFEQSRNHPTKNGLARLKKSVAEHRDTEPILSLSSLEQRNKELLADNHQLREQLTSTKVTLEKLKKVNE